MNGGASMDFLLFRTAVKYDGFEQCELTGKTPDTEGAGCDDKEQAVTLNPWDIWPDGVIPAEANRPALKLRTPEEGRKWLDELAESRKAHKLPEGGMTSLELIRQERDER